MYILCGVSFASYTTFFEHSSTVYT